MISAPTAQAVRRMLEMAVQPGGTAPRAQVTGYRVAGKTGTAHKLEGRGYASDKFVSSFVGFAPASAPRLVVAVMIDEPSAGQYYGGAVAAPVFSAVMAGAARARGAARCAGGQRGAAAGCPGDQGRSVKPGSRIQHEASSGQTGADWKKIEALGVRRLVNDSRAVRPGDTFVAYPGQSRDGRDYIAQAIANGAASVLWERAGFRWDPRWRVPNLGVQALRRHAGEIASRVHGRPSRRLRVIGVTGTNGKTTCSQWIAQALTRCGRRCAVIGTLGYGLRAPFKPLANTTPDALWLHAQLAEFARRGAQAVAMEVSSIGLDQDRVAGVEFDIALFTNLTRDHLEYHRTMRRYREAKARLFAWQTLKHAVVNLDDDFGAELARRIRRPGLEVIGYGFGAARGSVPRASPAPISSLARRA